MTWFSLLSWFGYWLFSSRYVFSMIPTQSITSTSNGLGLDSSKVTWIYSSVVIFLLLNILKVLLEVEYPMNIPSSSFASNFLRNMRFILGVWLPLCSWEPRMELKSPMKHYGITWESKQGRELILLDSFIDITNGSINHSYTYLDSIMINNHGDRLIMNR